MKKEKIIKVIDDLEALLSKHGTNNVGNENFKSERDRILKDYFYEPKPKEVGQEVAVDEPKEEVKKPLNLVIVISAILCFISIATAIYIYASAQTNEEILTKQNISLNKQLDDFVSKYDELKLNYDELKEDNKKLNSTRSNQSLVEVEVSSEIQDKINLLPRLNSLFDSNGRTHMYELGRFGNMGYKYFSYDEIDDRFLRFQLYIPSDTDLPWSYITYGPTGQYEDMGNLIFKGDTIFTMYSTVNCYGDKKCGIFADVLKGSELSRYSIEKTSNNGR